VVADACGTPGDATDADCWSDEASNKAYGPYPSTTGVSTDITLSNGKDNTAILAGLGGGYDAAEYCANLPDGGYDWYLPSYAELWDGYNAPAMSGGFPSAYYWSSTESSASPGSDAWLLRTFNNDMYSYGKNTNCDVRCLR